jgi:hypothetical protein
VTDEETIQILQESKNKLDKLREKLNEDMNEEEFNKLRSLINDQLFIVNLCEDLLRWTEDERIQRLGKIIIN